MLKDTATELDFRVTTPEKNGGSGNSSVGELEVKTIAFNSILTSYDTIDEGDTVVFNLVLLNEGNG